MNFNKIRKLNRITALIVIISFIFPNFIFSYTLFTCGSKSSKQSCCCSESNDISKGVQLKKIPCCKMLTVNSRPAPEAITFNDKLFSESLKFSPSLENYSLLNDCTFPQDNDKSPPGYSTGKLFLKTTVLRI